ncbi:MAG: HNH endonuclease signature motif containing protein [Planctomycetota bacterium]
MAILRQPRPKTGLSKRLAALYGTRSWKAYRKQLCRRRQLCERCRERPADLVDHIVPVRSGTDWPAMLALFHDRANHQVLCRPCHDAKTAEDRKKYPETYRVK